jgi:hypothetical protein
MRKTWVVLGKENSLDWAVGFEEECSAASIAVVHDNGNQEEARVNAYLIAAAPGLADALEGVVAAFDASSQLPAQERTEWTDARHAAALAAALSAARAALAKAAPRA